MYTQGPATETKDLLIVAGSGDVQPQAWVLTHDALHAAQPQSCPPCAALLSDDIGSLGTTGDDVQMQASYR